MGLELELVPVLDTRSIINYNIMPRGTYVSVIAVFIANWVFGMILQYVVAKELSSMGLVDRGWSMHSSLQMLRAVFSKKSMEGANAKLRHRCGVFRFVILLHCALMILVLIGTRRYSLE